MYMRHVQASTFTGLNMQFVLGFGSATLAWEKLNGARRVGSTQITDMAARIQELVRHCWLPCIGQLGETSCVNPFATLRLSRHSASRERCAKTRRPILCLFQVSCPNVE